MFAQRNRIVRKKNEINIQEAENNVANSNKNPDDGKKAQEDATEGQYMCTPLKASRKRKATEDPRVAEAYELLKNVVSQKRDSISAFGKYMVSKLRTYDNGRTLHCSMITTKKIIPHQDHLWKTRVEVVVPKCEIQRT